MNLVKNNNLWIKYYNFLTILFSLFLLFGTGGSSVLLVVWSVFSLFIFIKCKQYKELRKKDFVNVLILSIIPISYLLFLPFSEDKSLIIKAIERSIPLLILPLFFIFNKKLFLKETLVRFLISFAVSNVILAIFPWIKIFSIGYEKLSTENTFYNPVFRNIFNDTLGIHLPYLGLFFGFSIYILLISIIKSKNKWLKLIYSVMAFILIVSILQFAARMGLLSLFIALLLTVFIKIKYSIKVKILISISMCFLLVSLAFIEPMKSRVFNYTEQLELPHKGQSPEEFNPRYGIYNCVVTILKDNFWFGVGPSNVQNELNNCYDQYSYVGYDDFKHVEYNSHNQYADFLLKYGIYGLILFLVSLIWGISNKNIYYLGFISIFMMSLFTENILYRHFGIFFFALFNSFFFITKK